MILDRKSASLTSLFSAHSQNISFYGLLICFALLKKKKKISKYSYINVSHHITAYLPNPGQISQVEDIVELGWGGQHLDFGLLPQVTGCWDQPFHQLTDLRRETALLRNFSYKNELMLKLVTKKRGHGSESQKIWY